MRQDLLAVVLRPVKIAESAISRSRPHEVAADSYIHGEGHVWTTRREVNRVKSPADTALC